MIKHTFNIDWFAIHAVSHCNQKCKYCNNHSPFLKKREYCAEEYIVHIDYMITKGIIFNQIRIAGGEPFLHANLTNFVKTIKLRYAKSITIATNIFWLTLESIDKYEELLKHIDILFPSRYPNDGKDELLNIIRQRFSNIEISERIKNHFSKLEFLSKPQKVTKVCDLHNCTNLLTNGKLVRCATAAYADQNPNTTKEFLNSRIFFDLYKDNNIKKWIKQYPTNACSYCTLWKNDIIKWSQIKNHNNDNS